MLTRNQVSKTEFSKFSNRIRRETVVEQYLAISLWKFFLIIISYNVEKVEMSKKIEQTSRYLAVSLIQNHFDIIHFIKCYCSSRTVHWWTVHHDQIRINFLLCFYLRGFTTDKSILTPTPKGKIYLSAHSGHYLVHYQPNTITTWV